MEDIGAEIKYGQISTPSAGGQVLMVHTLDIKHISKSKQLKRDSEWVGDRAAKNAKSL